MPRRTSGAMLCAIVMLGSIACRRRDAPVAPAAPSVSASIVATTSASMSASAFTVTNPPPPPAKMLMGGPYATLEDACKRLVEQCAENAGASTCSCVAAHPEVAPPAEPVRGLDVVLVNSPPGATDVHRALPALRTADGWWVGPALADLQGLWSTGMESACSAVLARPSIAASTWNGHDGWYFRVEEDVTCWSRHPEEHGAPPPMRLGADAACAITAGGPTCALGGTGTIQKGSLPPVESSFSASKLP